MLVIASCTQSKRGRLQDACRLGHYNAPGLTAEAVHREWTSGLARSDPPERPVLRLYKGAYWSAVVELVNHLGAELRVTSAGFGLVDGRSSLPTYSATFSSGHADSVPGARAARERRNWWRLLDGPAQLIDSVERADGEVIAVLPKRYLRVTAPDLLRCPAQKLWVLGTSCPEDLRRHLGHRWLQLNGHMIRALQTNVSALIPAAALHIGRATREGWSADAAGRFISDLASENLKPIYPSRRQQSSHRILAWVESALVAADPPMSASAALRRFRGQGFACEQKRFHRIYRQVLTALGKE